MTTRTWINSKLQEVDLYGAGDRVFPKKSMRSSVEEHPFLVYKIGNDTNAGLAEDQTAARQFFQVWIHDYADSEAADYMRIDDLVAEIKGIFYQASSAADNILIVEYLETSQDLNDETLGTVFRYLRFQAIKGS